MQGYESGDIEFEAGMKQYKILNPVVLDFIFNNEQQSIIFSSNDNIIVETDGVTIWARMREYQVESITTPNAIDLWLRDGKLIPV